MRERINQHLSQIYQTIINQREHYDQNLYFGKAGKSLFTLLYAHHHDHTAIESANEYFQYFTEQLQEIEIHSTALAGGLSGIGWSFVLLQQLGVLDEAINPFLEEIDELVIAGAKGYLHINQEDFMHGAIGNIFYLLERREAIDKVTLQGLIDNIYDLAIKEKRQIFWLQPDSSTDDGNSFVSFGLAHGQMSKIAFYNYVIQNQIDVSKNTDLLQRCISTLWAYKNKRSEISIFPSGLKYTPPIHEKLQPQSRLAWCYGDLSSAYALIEVSKALSDKKLYQKAIKIALKTINRRTVEETLVHDAGICHGSSGLALMYLLLYKKTKIEDFKTTADYWIQNTLDKAVFEDGLAGYKAWQSGEGWRNESGILEGITGIGLSLIYAIDEKHNAWDECLLIS